MLKKYIKKQNKVKSLQQTNNIGIIHKINHHRSFLSKTYKFQQNLKIVLFLIKFLINFCFILLDNIIQNIGRNSMYGRNNTNIFSNNSTNNMNQSYNNSNTNNKLGTYRTEYRYGEPSALLLNSLFYWKENQPTSIVTREETLHLVSTELRVQDYYLIRQKQLRPMHNDKLRDAIQKECFNDQLLRNQCYDLFPYSGDRPINIDTLRGRDSYLYGNSNNGSNTNSSLYNTRSNSNIFNSSGNSNTNSNSNSTNIFNRNSNDNNSYNRDSNNSGSSNNIFNRNSTSNNNGNNNIFSNNNNNNNNSYSNNNNSSRSNNIFSGNSGYNNGYNNNGNNNNNNGNNIFNGNNNNSNNSFNGNNNNGNNLFNNNNGGNNLFNNNNNNSSNNGSRNYGNNNNYYGNNGSNNIFSNNNNRGNNNIFNNNSNNNNSNNNSNRNIFNNGGNMFNNNNNNSNGNHGNNLFNNNNQNNNTIFNNNGNYGINGEQLINTLYSCLNESRQFFQLFNSKLGQQITPPNYTAIPESKSKIFEEIEYQADFMDISSYTKMGKKEQPEFILSKEVEDLRNSRRTIEQQSMNKSRSVRGSRMGYSKAVKNSNLAQANIDRSSINNPSQSFNQDNFQKSSILSNKSQSFASPFQVQNTFQGLNSNSQLFNNPQQKPKFNQSQSLEPSKYRQLTKSKINNQSIVYDQHCVCTVSMRICWEGDFPELDRPVINTEVQLDRFQPNDNVWIQYLRQKLKEKNPIVRSDAIIVIIQIKREPNSPNRFILQGQVQQKVINLDDGYRFNYSKMRKNLIYNLGINNQHGSVTWNAPINALNLDFKIEQNPFSIENNAIMCEIKDLDHQCLVTFYDLPQWVKDIVTQDSILKARQKLNAELQKTSKGYFTLSNLIAENDIYTWSMTVERFDW